jgi:hypothetical protein
MTQSQVMEHLVKIVGISKKDAKLALDELNTLVVRELKKGRFDPPGGIGHFSQAQARCPRRAQSRYRRADQDSGAHAAALHSRQGAERVGFGGICASDEEKISR